MIIHIQDSGLKSTNKGVLTKQNGDRKEGVQETKKVEKKEVGAEHLKISIYNYNYFYLILNFMLFQLL